VSVSLSALEESISFQIIVHHSLIYVSHFFGLKILMFYIGFIAISPAKIFF